MTNANESFKRSLHVVNFFTFEIVFYSVIPVKRLQILKECGKTFLMTLRLTDRRSLQTTLHRNPGLRSGNGLGE